MNYAEDRLDRRARLSDDDDSSSASPLWIDFRQGLRQSDNRRIACSLKDAGWNDHAIFHYAQGWLERPDDADAAADYCQMVELAGYPVTALIALLVYRLSVPLRPPEHNFASMSDGNGSATSFVDTDPIWLLQPGKRKNQHCGCGLDECGASECFFVVSRKSSSLSPIAAAVQEFITTMPQRYQQGVPTSHFILGDLAKQRQLKRYGNSKDPGASVDPPLPSLFLFWEPDPAGSCNYRPLPLPFQLLAAKLFYLVMPAVAIEAVVRMTVDETSPLLRGPFKSHRAFYVFILSLALGERIKPQRRLQLRYSHEPLWDRLWASELSLSSTSCAAGARFLEQFQTLVQSLESSSESGEHSMPPLWLPPPFASEATISLYFVGDSHVLSMAWQTLHLSHTQQPVLVVPALVTGLKAWHVRSETHFFTQTCLQAWLSRLPSLIAVSAGEIDCREGLGGPLLEGYTTTCCRDHIQRTVQAYVAALREHETSCLVLPVAPHLHRKGNVDGQTSRRETMRAWNQELRNELQKAAHNNEHEGDGPDLYLLDYSDLLRAAAPRTDEDDRSYTLNPLFNADGTHLNAAFAPILTASIEAVVNQSERVRRYFESAS